MYRNSSFIIHFVHIYGMLRWNKAYKCKCAYIFFLLLLHLNSHFLKKKKVFSIEDTQICVFFIWKYFHIQCEHAVETKSMFWSTFFSSSLSQIRLARRFTVATVPFRVNTERQKSNGKNNIALKWKKNETKQMALLFFRSFNTDFYIFCSLLNANFSVKHFFSTLKIYNYLFKVVQVSGLCHSMLHHTQSEVRKRKG